MFFLKSSSIDYCAYFLTLQFFSGKPFPTSQPWATEIDCNWLTLSWRSPNKNNTEPIIAYTVEQATALDRKAWKTVTTCCQSTSHHIKNLLSNEEYVFRVKAENVHGRSKWSALSVILRTKLFTNKTENTFADSSAAMDCTDDHQHASKKVINSCQVSRQQPAFKYFLESSLTSLLSHSNAAVNTNCATQRLNLTSSHKKLLLRSGCTLPKGIYFRRSMPVGDYRRHLAIILPGSHLDSLGKLHETKTLPNVNNTWIDYLMSLQRVDMSQLCPHGRSISGDEKFPYQMGSERNMHQKYAKLLKQKEDICAEDVSPLKIKNMRLTTHSETNMSNVFVADNDMSTNKNAFNEIHDYIDMAPCMPMWRTCNSIHQSKSDENCSNTDNFGSKLVTFRTVCKLLNSKEIFIKKSLSLPDVTSMTIPKYSGSIDRRNADCNVSYVSNHDNTNVDNAISES